MGERKMETGAAQLLGRIVRYRMPGAKLIGVKSWVPAMGEYGLEWPLLVVEEGGERRTVAPVWPPKPERSPGK